MRFVNPHRQELVAAVAARLAVGDNLRLAAHNVLSDPPRPLYERLAPAPRTLIAWYIEDNPKHRVARTSEARALLDQGQTQNQVARHFGVTTRTIRNWLRT